jgi:hypothetical protein
MHQLRLDNHRLLPQIHHRRRSPREHSNIGYSINHSSLLASNITATKHFHVTILDMCELFTYESSKDMVILYMGHSRGARTRHWLLDGRRTKPREEQPRGFDRVHLHHRTLVPSLPSLLPPLIRPGLISPTSQTPSGHSRTSGSWCPTSQPRKSASRASTSQS